MKKQIRLLAYRNVLRNKRRSFLTMVVILFSVGIFLFFLSYVEGMVGSMIDDTIKATGHIAVQHEEYSLKERMLSLSVPVENFSEIKAEISALPEVKSVTGRIKFGGLLDFAGKNEPGMGMAMDFKEENNFLNIENLIIEGATAKGGRETVIGVAFANRLHVSVGDTITVISRTAYSSMAAELLVVTGIADFLNSAMNRLFYMDLAAAQYMLDMDNQVIEVVVFLHDMEQSDQTAAKISEMVQSTNGYSVLTWDVKGNLKLMLPMMNVFIAILVGIFGLIASFSIINTMLMSVFERTNEIGVLTAFGMKRREILQIFLLEAVLIGIFGGLIGLIIGGAGGYWMETVGFTMGKLVDDFPIPIRQTLRGDLQFMQFVYSFLLGIGLSVIGAIFPAMKAARLNPTDALREQ